jgi:hypothetical protein
VRPRTGSKAVCSGCHRPASGYDHLPERRFEFIPFWGFLVFLLYSMRRVDCRRCNKAQPDGPYTGVGGESCGGQAAIDGSFRVGVPVPVATELMMAMSTSSPTIPLSMGNGGALQSAPGRVDAYIAIDGDPYGYRTNLPAENRRDSSPMLHCFSARCVFPDSRAETSLPRRHSAAPVRCCQIRRDGRGSPERNILGGYKKLDSGVLPKAIWIHIRESASAQTVR